MVINLVCHWLIACGLFNSQFFPAFYLYSVCLCLSWLVKLAIYLKPAQSQNTLKAIKFVSYWKQPILFAKSMQVLEMENVSNECNRMLTITML